MKISFYLSLIPFLLLSSHANSQSTITFDNQGWSSDQSIDTIFTIDNFTFSSNKNLFTNYGYNFNVNGVSIYYAFQNSVSDNITITTQNNELVNLSSLAVYQVSETGSDTLIIEGWDGTDKKYSIAFSKINTWRILTLDYNNINKLVIKSGNLSNTGLLDYNFDNISFSSTTDVESINNPPQSYSLSQNYPNPFNPSTIISYTIPSNLAYRQAGVNGEMSNVVLKVFDILGNEVAILVNEEKDAGNYSVTFNAENLSSGMYIYTLIADGFKSSHKMMLIK